MKTKTLRRNRRAPPELAALDHSRKDQSRRGNGLLHNLLVPTDFSIESRNALEYAKALADRFGAEITLLHVVAPLVCTADFGYGQVNRSSPNHELLKKAKARLEAIARAHQIAGRMVATTVCSGGVEEEIINAANELGADLIVMGATGNNQDPGGIADRMVHSAPCAVLVIRKKHVSHDSA